MISTHLRPCGLLLLPVLALAAQGVTACSSAGGDGAGTANYADTINPSGTDAPGTLLVTAPDGASLPNVALGSVDANPLGAQPDQGYPGLSVGSHQIFASECRLTTNGDPQVRQTCSGAGTTVQIKSNQTTTLALGGVRLQRTGTDALLLGNEQPADQQGSNLVFELGGLDEPFVRATSLKPPVSGIFRAFGSHEEDGAAFFHEAADKTYAALPMTYHYQWGLFDGADVAVRSGQIATVDLDARTNRRSIRVTAPTRAFPNARASMSPGSAVDCSAWIIGGTRSDANGTTIASRTTSAFHPNDGQTIIVGEFVADDLIPVSHYLALGPTSQSTPNLNSTALGLGQVGGEPAALKVGRIDVGHVAVTQGDGTTVTVVGSYDVQRPVVVQGVEQFQSIGCPAPTNTGIDVLPGRYRVVVDYDTAESGHKQDVHDITIQ